MANTILVTGGTGKTGRRVAKLLQQQGEKVRIASRQAAPGTTHFNWIDPSTFEAAAKGVRAIYLVAPTGVADLLLAMQPFLEHALVAGVQRFILLSSSAIEEGGPAHGQIHRFLKDHAPAWTALRPTWFMQNFSEHQHVETIRREGKIYSATGNGRVPFIDAGDIAAVATQALTMPAFPNGELILTGPELLSYDEVAAAISAMAGYAVQHIHLTKAEMKNRFIRASLPMMYAEMLASLDANIAEGSEERLTEAVQQLLGRPAKAFAEFAHNAVATWERL